MIRTLSRIAGAATLALALGAAALTAAPAQAASFQFGAGPNNGPSFSFQFGNDHRPPRPAHYCLNDRQLEREIGRQGYRNVDIQVHGRNWVVARGTSRGWVYKLTADACDGRIMDRDRLWRF